MKSFEERKKEYLERLQSNEELAAKIFKDYNKTEERKKRLALIFTPRNERELDLAEIMYSLLDDSYTLRDDIENKEIKIIPLEENEGFKVYVSVIKALYNGDNETALRLAESIVDKSNAKLLYGVGASSANDSGEIFEYICNELGINKDNVTSIIQLVVYLEESTQIMEEKSKTFDNKKPEEYTEEEIQQFREYAAEFHQLCVEGKIEKEETEVDQRILQLAKLITDAIFGAIDKDDQ